MNTPLRTQKISFLKKKSRRRRGSHMCGLKEEERWQKK